VGFRTTYKIVIEEVRESEVDSQAEYQVVADSGNKRDGGVVREYVVPPGKRFKRDETRIFFQEVGDLDLVKVIKAINGVE